MENREVVGRISKLAAKCGMSSSKFFSTSLLLVFLISASYVLVFGDTNLSATVSPNGATWLKGNTSYQINFTVGGGPDYLTEINVTNANFTITNVLINLSSWGWGCSNTTTFVNCTNLTADANATSALLTITATTPAAGEYAAHNWSITTLDNSSVANSTFVTSEVDAVAPRIVALANPQNGTVVSNKQTLTFNISVIDAGSSAADGASACIVNVGGKPNVTVAASSGWCNMSGVSLADLALGAQTINIVVNDSVGNVHSNNTYVLIIGGTPIPGITQWNTSLQGPSLNLSAGDIFFYDTNTISVIANFTTIGSDGASYPYDNLTIVGNATSVGDGSPTVTELGGGLYRITAVANYSNITAGVSQFVGAPINPLVWNASSAVGPPINFGQPLMAVAVLVNMSTIPSCPPDSSQVPPAIPWGGGLKFVANCTPSTQAPCSTATSPVYQINSTHVILCGPNFGPATTNFSDIAYSGNFSAVPLVIDVPGKAKINFTNPVDMGDQQKSQAIMEFAVKNLMARGQFGINESEWNGQGGKPNLNISAILTLYNISALLGGNHYSIGFGEFNGMEGPTSTSICPPSRCSGMSFDGENMTFSVSSFSTYVIGGVNYTLVFSNTTAIAQSVNQSVNATYYINISNAGNNTDEITYNLSVQGIGSLNVSQITLNSTAIGGTTWYVVQLNVSNATAGIYQSNVTAVLSDNAGVEHNSLTSGLNSPIITTVLDSTNPSVYGGVAVAAADPGSNLTLNITATDNVAISAVLVNLSLIGGSPTAQMTNIGGDNYQLNATVALYTLNGTYVLAVRANDTAGNVNNTATISATVNNVAPSVTVSYPNGGERITGTVTINATATDNNGNSTITNVTFYYTTDGSTYTLIGAQNVSQGNAVYNVSWSTPALESTNVTVVANATDGVNVGTDPSNAAFTVDNVAPAVLGGLSTPTSADPGATVKLNVTVTDGVNISQVFVNLSNVGLGALTAMTRVSGTGTNDVYEYNLTVPVGYVGAKTFGLRANDTGGNANTTGTIALTVNNVAPVVVVIYPNGGEVIAGTVTINATATDNNGNNTIATVWFYYSSNGGSTWALIGNDSDNTDAVYNFTWNTTGQNGQAFRILANTTDGIYAANDTSNSNFTVDNTAPSVAVTVLPATAYTPDDLVCNITASDNIASTINVYWIWYNGSTVKFSGATAASNDTGKNISTLGAGNTTKGETWKCSVLVGDGYTNATQYANASEYINNSAPSVPSLVLPSSGLITNDNTTLFTWDASTDEDGDAITYAIEISANSSFAYVNQSNYALSANNYTPAGLAESIYYWHAWSITSDANSSASGYRNFTVDITAPTGISITAPSSVTVGAAISATCTASDNFDSSVSCSCNSPSTASAGTATVTCTATDDAGNSAQGTRSVTVTSLPSSGGIAIPTPPSQTHSWVKLTPGAAAIMKITNSELGITEITVNVANEANNAKITVTKLDGKPASVVHEIAGNVYKYLEITRENLNESSIKSGNLKFRVEKSWLDKNGLDKSTVVLSRYTAAWTPLATRQTSEDNAAIYYEADTPGFSYFAISAEEKKAEVPPNQTAPAEPLQTTTPTTTAPAQPADISDTTSQGPTGEVVSDGKIKSVGTILVVILALLAVLFVIMKKR